MQPDLLSTKLYAPNPGQALVTRPRLDFILSKALTVCLTLVSAPAGYGKTTLVSSWLRSTGVVSSWLSLEEADNDPIRFFQYFISAVQTLLPTRLEDLTGRSQEMQPVPLDVLINRVINEIARCASPLVLVLDDFHVIHAQPILDLLCHFIEHAPPQIHLILLSRIDPPLPLARLRARGRLVDIRADQLRFTLEEVEVFLNESMGLKLPAGDVTAMERRTEGWIAGLQLAALSMQGCSDRRGFVSAFSGSHYSIMDYLAEEVLKLQPEGVSSFLLKTSILDRLCGSVCSAVIEPDKASPVDGQALLEDLERKNLFVIPLDNERRWYRYHHLFTDVLNRRLERLYPSLIPQLHHRASLWYEQYGLIPEAITHALKAGDRQRAAKLIEQNGCALLMSGEVITLLGWIEAVEPYGRTHPWVTVQKAWALTLAGRLDEVEQALQSAEQLISTFEPDEDVRTLQGIIAADRAFRSNGFGDAGLAVKFARQALEYLPESDPLSRSMRSVSISIIGDASRRSGNLKEAAQACIEAARISRVAGNTSLLISNQTDLAGILLEQGQLRQAASLYYDSLELAVRPDGRRSPLADRILAGLSRINYEWNQLDRAAEYAHQCIELCQLVENIELQAVAGLLLARAEYAQCILEAALESMRDVELISEGRLLSPRASTRVKTGLARLWIAFGDLEGVSHLLQEHDITKISLVADSLAGGGGNSSLQESEYLVLLHLLLTQGDHEAVISLSQGLLREAETANRVGRIIEILVMRSLALQGKKDTPQALSDLERGLVLAQPEGYVRVFLDEGEPMLRLLFQVKSQRAGTGYASELLSAAVVGKPGERLPPAQQLVEPLTERELEVLKLIEAGNSNQEIAAQLYISLATVKRHISNIYSKLGAANRTQAISRGKELMLFGL